MPAPDSLPYSSSRHRDEQAWVFEELPKATVVSVSRPETGDISPMLLSYTIEFQYKQFKWILLKKASKVLYLHFTLKKRAIIEEFHQRQDQAKEWLQNLGIVDHIAVVRDDDDDHPAVLLCQSFGQLCHSSSRPSQIELKRQCKVV